MHWRSRVTVACAVAAVAALLAPHALPVAGADALVSDCVVFECSDSAADSEIDGVCLPQTLERSDNTQLPAQQDTMFRTRKIATKFVAGEQSEGVGARVRRSIGSHKLRNLDPFLMLDEAVVAQPAGFPDHPHRGFETVSYMLPSSKGVMLHEDFLGNKGENRPGDLQWMSAGRGILHSELPASTDSAHGLQLWINLPRHRKMMEPQYQEIKREDVPHAFNSDKSVEAIVFSGEVFGVTGPIKPESPVTYVHFIMQRGAKLQYSIPDGHNAFVYMLTGNAECDGQRVAPHEAVVLEQEGDGLAITADGQGGSVEFIVLSGKPLGEPIVQYGPFVMNTEDEIREAMHDFRSGRNGFENAPNWVSSLSQRLR